MRSGKIILRINMMFVLMLVLFSAGANANCDVDGAVQSDYSAIGVVKNSDGQVVYEEHHSHQSDPSGGASRVDYKSPDGQLIASKTVQYDCRFSAPRYTLKMAEDSPWTEQVQWQSSQLVISQANDNKILDVNNDDDIVIDAGFDNYIVKHWQALLNGEQKQINFLHVPASRLINLVIELVDIDQDKVYSSSSNIAVFKISTKNKLLRLFTDSIYLGYDKSSQKLDFYAGPTNLRGAIAGLDKSDQIVINYRYN